MNLVWLSVKRVVVDASIVDAILLATSDSNFHLKPLVDLGHACKVLLTNGDVVVLGLLGEIEHVRGKQGLAVLLVIRLIGFKHAVKPGEQLLGAMVRMQDYRPAGRETAEHIVNSEHSHSIGFRDSANVVSSSDCTGDGCLLLIVRKTLAGEVRRATLRDLKNNRRFDVAETIDECLRSVWS